MSLTKTNNRKLISYNCQISVKSKCLKHLNTWYLLIFNSEPVVSKLKIKRFTLLRSPLGNKRSKDQFEFREWSLFFCIEDINPSYVLYMSQIMLIPVGLKIKLNLYH